MSEQFAEDAHLDDFGDFGEDPEVYADDPEPDIDEQFEIESSLASAGWGTDEDYGYYGGDEDYY